MRQESARRLEEGSLFTLLDYGLHGLYSTILTKLYAVNRMRHFTCCNLQVAGLTQSMIRSKGRKNTHKRAGSGTELYRATLVQYLEKTHDGEVMASQ